MEQNYEFRKKLLSVHRADIRDENAVKTAEKIEIDERYQIAISKNCSRVLLNAALDLQNYLFSSMNVSVPVKKHTELSCLKGKNIIVATYKELGLPWAGACISGACKITADEDIIVICGVDDRGSAQGCYALEDQMNQVWAPFIHKGSVSKTPAFSPRMVHSGYGLDQFPDAHLSAIAHAGMDAILVFVKGVNQTPTGHQDFNELIYRAGGYGLDVYAYIYFESSLHPDDEKAFAYYDSTYGNLFRVCPGLKGMVLVGESVEFPSKDPRVSDKKYYENVTDGIYTGKPTAGWFPCEDYHRWVGLLQKVVQQYKPEADIVFWTYNWGYAPKEDRLRLIESLPAGISLMVTFEMFEERYIEDVRASTVDYTLSFAGPGDYFSTEAQCAKARGLRLYAQANSAGLTWDFGVIPYEPCPMQWAKRYEAMRKAKEDYGLCGVMESHHYGFWPSFISQIEKRMFTNPAMGAEEAIRLSAEELYGADNAEKAMEAWDCFSKAITYYPCTNEDQYGPFRIGPSYPLVFRSDVQIPTVPYAMFGGNKICFTEYASDALYKITSHTLGRTGMIQQRIPSELQCLKTMKGYFEKGGRLLAEIAKTRSGVQKEDCLTLLNMVDFMECCILTVIHVKQWSLCKWKVRSEMNSQEIIRLLEEMITIGYAEIENAKRCIPMVQTDSRLGWEPSMEYMTDASHLEWKIRQTTQVVEQELPRYIASLQS